MNGNTIARGGARVAGVRVRVLTHEVHRLENHATQYGVESGKSVSDHIVMAPNVVDVRFEMTNANRGAEEARDVFQQFRKMMEDRALVTLDTEHARYRNMALVAFAPEHRAPYRGAYAATARFMQVGIIGADGGVAAAGGRPAGILAGGGVDRLASGLVNGGDARLDRDPNLLAAVLGVLRERVA